MLSVLPSPTEPNSELPTSKRPIAAFASKLATPRL
jgi:hypothetical protein